MMRSILQILAAAAMAVPAGSPAHAQQNVYGGHDIAGGGAVMTAAEPAGEAALQTGSLFRNVMYGCYLTTNDNGEISCDMTASAGSRWELSPEDDGRYSSLYNPDHNCAVAMGRDSADSDQVSCYFNGDERRAALEFSLPPLARLSIWSMPGATAVSTETRRTSSPAWRLRDRAISGGRWCINGGPPPAGPRVRPGSVADRSGRWPCLGGTGHRRKRTGIGGWRGAGRLGACQSGRALVTCPGRAAVPLPDPIRPEEPR